MENQKTWTWFNTYVGDYFGADAANNQGIDTEDYGKSEHAIKMDGVDYEIGVVKRKDGTGYSLVWDFWGQGNKINQYIGKGAEQLMVEYQREYCLQHAQEQGLMVSESSDDEFLYLTLES